MRWKLLLASFCTIWLIATVAPVAADAVMHTPKFVPLEPAEGPFGLSVTACYMVLAGVTISLALVSFLFILKKSVAVKVAVATFFLVAIFAIAFAMMAREAAEEAHHKEYDRNIERLKKEHNISKDNNRYRERERNREQREKERQEEMKNRPSTKKTKSIPQSQN